MTKSDKRRRLIDAASALAYREGYEKVALADIAREAKVPLGNVYYYFKTKAEIRDAIVARRVDDFEALRRIWETAPSAKERLAAYVEMTAANRGAIARYGCPVGSLCSELAKGDPTLAVAASRPLAELRRWIEAQFEALGRGDEKEALALHLVSAVQGVSLLANGFDDPDLVLVEAAHLESVDSRSMRLTAATAKTFGPWSLVTGASSGIGAAFARHLAASGLNVALAARRGSLLDALGAELARKFGVQTRSIVVDLSESGSVARLADSAADLDIGSVISNAGTGSPGRFVEQDAELQLRMFALNALAHLNLARRFAPKFVARGGGGLLLGGAMGAAHGIPFMANDAGAKAYVQSLGESLHGELERHGVHVTVLVVPPTDTAIIAKFGLDPKTMPIKPMSPARCASGGLRALQQNRSLCLPGAANRLMSAMIPARFARSMMGKMIGRTITGRGLRP